MGRIMIFHCLITFYFVPPTSPFMMAPKVGSCSKGCDCVQQPFGDDLVVHCSLSTLDDILHGLPPDTEKITLLVNKIKRIDKFAFKNLTQLKSLKVIGRLTECHVSEYSFSNLTELLSLTLEFKRITYLHQKAFSKLVKLERLELGRNQLSTIHEKTFDELVELEALYLNDNKLKFLHKKSFINLYELSTLSLSNNLINSLDKNLFSSQRNLKKLFLSENEIKILDKNLFQNVTPLTDLLLSYNKLQKIPNEIFRNLSLLRKINLAFNNITYIRKTTFEDVVEANSIVLRGNQISTIDDFAFFNLSKLEVLNVRENALTNITEKMFKGLKALTTLHLRKNKIKFIHPKAFKDMKMARRIYLSDNHLRFINKTLFFDLIELMIIDLNHNEITSLGKDTFLTQFNLASLWLNYNKLTSLPKDIFRNCKSPWLSLQLRGNNLIQIKRDGFSAKRTLDVRENNVFCTCYLAETLKLLEKKRIIVYADCWQDDKIINYEKIECEFLRKNWIKNELVVGRTALAVNDNVVVIKNLTDQFMIRFDLKDDRYGECLNESHLTISTFNTSEYLTNKAKVKSKLFEIMAIEDVVFSNKTWPIESRLQRKIGPSVSKNETVSVRITQEFLKIGYVTLISINNGISSSSVVNELPIVFPDILILISSNHCLSNLSLTNLVVYRQNYKAPKDLSLLKHLKNILIILFHIAYVILF